MEGEGILVKPEFLKFHRELWQRQQEALRKALPTAQADEEAAFEAARNGLDVLEEQPEWVKGAPLYPHQLKVSFKKHALLNVETTVLMIVLQRTTGHSQCWARSFVSPPGLIAMSMRMGLITCLRTLSTFVTASSRRGPSAAAHPQCWQAVNWLREGCVEGLSAVLADEQGLGKTAAVIAFVQSLRHEFKSLGPVLVVMPPAKLAFWEGEFAFWAGGGLNVVPFSGSALARSIIHDHELWLSPTSLDGRSTFGVQSILQAKVCAASSLNPKPLLLS